MEKEIEKEKKKIIRKFEIPESLFGKIETIGRVYKHKINIFPKEKKIGNCTGIKIKKGKIEMSICFNKAGIKLLKDIEKAGDPMGILDLFKIKKI